MMSQNQSKWLLAPRHRTKAHRKLIAFHHAGGSATAFRCWQGYLYEDTALYPVILPAHDTRLSESYPETVQALAQAFVSENRQLLAEDGVCLYGHSMGAIFAYETAAAAERMHLGPAALIVSGEVAPRYTVLKKESRGMDRQAFLQLIRDYAGMDSALLEDPVFMRYYYPVIRGDFTFYESYEPGQVYMLHCPVCVINGSTDPHIVPEQVQGWKAYSACRTDFFSVDGGHFFAFEQAEATCRILNQYLNRVVSHDEG